MRSGVDLAKLNLFMQELGRSTIGPGKVYLVGGSTALILGIRPQTVDVDLKLDPEPKGAFEAIAKLKEQLDLNVELAAPDDFIPALPGWRERSDHIARYGQVDFYHYDFYAQALAKIQRGFPNDLSDARELVRLDKVRVGELRLLFQAIHPLLIRYPGLDAAQFAKRVDEFVEQCKD